MSTRLNWFRWIAVALLAVAVCNAPAQNASAKNSPGTPLHPVLPRPPLDTNSAIAPSLTHKLVVGDSVEIKVYQEDDLTTRARIEADGTVTMPLLGPVKIQGRTTEQAQAYIRELLLKDYLTNPQVTLALLEPAKKRFCVLGEVRQPGYYQIPENETITVPQAISIAGGFSPYGSPRRVSIKRVINGQETVLSVNVGSMSRKENTELANIEPGDTIVVATKIW